MLETDFDKLHCRCISEVFAAHPASLLPSASEIQHIHVACWPLIGCWQKGATAALATFLSFLAENMARMISRE